MSFHRFLPKTVRLGRGIVLADEGAVDASPQGGCLGLIMAALYKLCTLKEKHE